MKVTEKIEVHLHNTEEHVWDLIEKLARARKNLINKDCDIDSLVIDIRDCGYRDDPEYYLVVSGKREETEAETATRKTKEEAQTRYRIQRLEEQLAREKEVLHE